MNTLTDWPRLYQALAPRSLDEVCGQDRAIARVKSIQATVGLGGNAVWINGPSGHGKSLIAGLIAREFAAYPSRPLLRRPPRRRHCRRPDRSVTTPVGPLRTVSPPQAGVGRAAFRSALPGILLVRGGLIAQVLILRKVGRLEL